ncbi:hypothetical protein GS597_18485 [Synechococcales cyanobacterium C]|uniref:Carrier domain-containing protein n=1 Tax=Petrachloros mirabilis ULC683 TaxID=2781853 RepID=A0A8K2A252_9CYAN|nr:hypothetical protein [Petrachloros mirabilis]NCJ08457.1 hypothetical protein [Petrachloros mirabilis ULC683]
MSSLEIIQKVSLFIKEKISESGNLTLKINESLLENELINSLDILKIIEFIELQYDIELEDEDINPANFETIEHISKLVETKLARKHQIGNS